MTSFCDKYVFVDFELFKYLKVGLKTFEQIFLYTHPNFLLVIRKKTK